MEVCTKEREIDDIQKDIIKIEQSIEGNGKPGIKYELTEMRLEQKITNQTLAALNTNVSALMLFQAEMKTVERIKLQVRDIVNMIITAVLSASAVAVALIIT